jgi:predicted AAA+ superfamily ATPase
MPMLPQAVWPRGIARRLQESLADTPVVLLNGPRQSGKTTLVRQFASDQRPYLTLDDATTAAAARQDPQGFLRRLDGAVIDEVQRVPELLLAIKLAVDERRRPGRFLLTGSADVLALPRVADSLAGRVEVLSLLPLAGCELAGAPSGWIDELFAALAANARPPSPPPDQAATQVGEALEQRVLAGGYPVALHRSSESRRQAWARSYLSAILQRDVRDIADVEKLQALPQLLAALAQVCGQLCNYTQLGARIGLNGKTVSRYLTILEQVFLVRRVPAWSGNGLARIVKTPKVQFLDSCLLSHLLGLKAARVASDRTAFGTVVECFAYGELLRLASWADDSYDLMMYRDKDQLEVDVVIANGLGQLVGVEIKASASVQGGHLAGLRRLAAQSGDRFLGGVILYDGIQSLPMGSVAGRPIWALPLASLWHGAPTAAP